MKFFSISHKKVIFFICSFGVLYAINAQDKPVVMSPNVEKLAASIHTQARRQGERVQVDLALVKTFCAYHGLTAKKIIQFLGSPKGKACLKQLTGCINKLHLAKKAGRSDTEITCMLLAWMGQFLKEDKNKDKQSSKMRTGKLWTPSKTQLTWIGAAAAAAVATIIAVAVFVIVACCAVAMGISIALLVKEVVAMQEKNKVLIGQRDEKAKSLQEQIEKNTKLTENMNDLNNKVTNAEKEKSEFEITLKEKEKLIQETIKQKDEFCNKVVQLESTNNDLCKTVELHQKKEREVEENKCKEKPQEKPQPLKEMVNKVSNVGAMIVNKALIGTSVDVKVENKESIKVTNPIKPNQFTSTTPKKKLLLE